MTILSSIGLPVVRRYSYVFTFALIAVLTLIAQAQPEFSIEELKNLKERKLNPDIFRSHLSQDRFPMPDITASSSPLAADGDGKSDFAVFRNGNWNILQSTNGFTVQGFGVNLDLPTPSAFIQ